MRLEGPALALTALIAATPAVAVETTFVESFDGGSNDGGWTFGAADSIFAAGGNPGAYLHTQDLDTFAPRPRTTFGDSFIGDYRAMGVSGVGADFITLNSVSTGDRPMTLMLIHNNGTPGNPFDDTGAYFMGPNVPAFGAGWASYDFEVPAAETGLPGGWQLFNFGDSGAPANHTWDEVIRDVTQVLFHYGDPTFFFIFQTWELGLDNPRITFDDPGVPGDATGDGVVNVDDLVEVVLQWGNCPAPPDPCPADLTGDGVVNVDDLIEVVLNWT